MRRALVFAFALSACGRTGFNAPPAPGVPAAPAPCAAAGGVLGEAKYPVVSSLAVLGDELYVTSHEPYRPMQYRTPGAVERLSRCGGALSAIGPADEDFPDGLVASGGFVHWRARDFNAVGESRGELVRSWPREGSALVSRRLARRYTQLSGPFVSGQALFWLASHRTGSDLQSAGESSETVRAVGGFGVSTLLGAGDALIRVEQQPPLSRVSALDALGQEVHLWSVRYDTAFLGIEGGAACYQEYDEAAKQLVVRRRQLEGGAEAELLYVPEGRAERGLAAAGALYVAEPKRLVRVDLADRRVTVLRELQEPDERVLALAHDGERLYVALGSGFGQESAMLYALEP